MYKYQRSPNKLNYACLILGMAGVWHNTHSWPVMAWAFLASLNFTLTRKDNPNA